ncbi:hypothetical protein [Pantoea sp. Ap-967]|nr:hypothetical protein [Pantoea sp. Ap-967]
MNWTPIDSALLLALGIFVISTYCIVRGMVIKATRKREERV